MSGKNNTWYRQVSLLLSVSFALTACVPPPADEPDLKEKQPILKPKPITPPKPIKAPSKSSPDDKRVQRVPGLPTGWTMQDPKKVIKSVETASDTGNLLITTSINAGLEVISVIDAQNRDWYRGKLDGAHLIALPTDADKILITFSNRKNARTSVLLKRNR